MAKKPGTRTIVVSRQQQADPLDPAPPPPAEHSIDGCIIWPQSAREEEGGWVGLDGYSVAAPYGCDVQADDQVRLLDVPNVPDDVLWDVNGTPIHYESKKGRPKAAIINLTRAS